jgi:hypothetical protein
MQEQGKDYLEEKYVAVDDAPKGDAEWMYWHGWGGDDRWPLPVLVTKSDVASRYSTIILSLTSSKS